MPTYEYKCTNDGELFELWQEVGAPAPPCPTCGAPSKKVFHPARVIFKGSGFYVTDTRAESQSAGKSASSESASTDAPKADANAPQTEASKAESSKAEPSKSESAKSDG